MKKIASIIVAFVIVAGSIFGAAPVAGAVNLDTGNTRTNVGLRDEERAVNEFERAYMSYRMSFISISNRLDTDAVKDRADEVIVLNQRLQETQFPTRISQEFTDAAVSIKQAAQALTDKVAETSSTVTEETDGQSIIEELEPQQRVFETAAADLEQGATNYNPSNWPVILGILGAIALALVISYLVAKRNVNKLSNKIFGNDPAAAALLSPAQKKLIARLHRDVALYAKAMDQQNGALMQYLEAAAYKEYFDRTDQESFGKFASIPVEYRALVRLRHQDTDGARQDAQHAASLRQNQQLITQRAKQLL